MTSLFETIWNQRSSQMTFQMTKWLFEAFEFFPIDL